MNEHQKRLREAHRMKFRPWRSGHGRKIVHQNRRSALWHIILLGLTGDEWIRAFWRMTMYRCRFTDDFRVGRTGAEHWHVAHRKTRRERGVRPW